MAINIVDLIQHHLGKPDLECPIFVCDYCGQPIIHRVTPEGGVYAWKRGEDYSIVHFHNTTRCWHSHEKKCGEGWSWNYLYRMVAYLVNSLELGDQDRQEVIDTIK